MNINDIHRLILFFLNKEQQGYVTHAEIDDVLDVAQMQLFDEYHKEPKGRQRLAYGQSQRIDDALSPFKRQYSFVTGSDGIVTLPNDYLNMSALMTTYISGGNTYYQPVEVLTEEELIERLNSQVIPVTPNAPICIMNYQNKIQLFPEQITTGKVFYFKRPATPVFGYTTSGRTITYNSGTSTQLEWKDGDILNVIIKALSYYGLNMSAQDVMQFAQIKEQ